MKSRKAESVIPCMFSMPEVQILNRSGDQLTVCFVIVFFVHFSKAEGLEYVWIFVELLIIVQRSSSDADQRSFRYKSSIRESIIFHSLARDGHYKNIGRSGWLPHEGMQKWLTRTHPFQPLGFSKEAVDFTHFTQWSLGPSFVFDNGFNFLAKWLDILRILRKVEKRVSKPL